MSRDLLDLVRELNTLNDDNLADRVIENSDVQWCLSELQDILEEMSTLTPPNEPERAGLYGKYTVYKNKDGSLVTDCFVLRPAKDPAAVAALRAYATATDNAELSADIINWVGAEPSEWVSVEERLPTDEHPVLVFVGYVDTMTGFVTTSSYFCFDENPHWQWDGLVRDEQRTLFWMPLPAPPDKEQTT